MSRLLARVIQDIRTISSNGRGLPVSRLAYLVCPKDYHVLRNEIAAAARGSAPDNELQAESIRICGMSVLWSETAEPVL